MHPNVAGRKKKEQHDANQPGIGLNPAYAGAYGATPPVSMFSDLLGVSSVFFMKLGLKI